MMSPRALRQVGCANRNGFEDLSLIKPAFNDGRAANFAQASNFSVVFMIHASKTSHC
jgi:hypothetical protein